MWTFQDAIRAGAGSVMCSYNQLNGSYGCQNSKALNGLLKGELGFQGFVVSDWGYGIYDRYTFLVRTMLTSFAVCLTPL
jgi:beta-glucosidase-like glycosyl hydrolase